MRDTTIMMLLCNQGKLDITTREGWSYDPYDTDFHKGFLMNMSEQACYDEMFPNHPLSVARRFVKYIIEHN